MTDASKPDEKKSDETIEEKKEEPIEKPQPESEEQAKEETEDKTDTEEVTEETTKEPETKDEPEIEEGEEITEETDEEIVEEPTDETKPEPETEPGEEIEKKIDEEPTEPGEPQVKAEKTEEKKEKPKKKIDRGPDFKYIVRLSNTDVDGEKNVVYGLTSIKGIGVHLATLISDETGINRYGKMGDLTDAQVDKLQELIDSVNKNAPDWMLNRRKDYESGEDNHLIASDIDMRLRDEINIMKKIRSYKGIRHESGLRVRGQRTRANNRKGLALGVSKKRELSSSK